MKPFLRALSTALALEGAPIRDGFFLVMEAIAAGSLPGDWAAIRNAVPGAIRCLDPRLRTGAATMGPPPQTPEGFMDSLESVGIDRWRAPLLVGLTLRYLGSLVSEERVLRIGEAVQGFGALEQPGAEHDVDVSVQPWVGESVPMESGERSDLSPWFDDPGGS